MEPSNPPAPPPLADPPAEPAYEVGYGRPPLHGRWKPGQSGNPKGRPRKAARQRGRVAALVEDCLSQRVDLPPGPSGRRRRARLAPLTVRTLAAAMEAGDVRAALELMRALQTAAKRGR